MYIATLMLNATLHDSEHVTYRLLAQEGVWPIGEVAQKVSALVSWVPCTAAPGSRPRDPARPPRAILLLKFSA